MLVICDRINLIFGTLCCAKNFNMFFLKVATFFIVALAVGAEKKIELQDIEEDNLRSELKSELEKDHEKSDDQNNSEAGLGFNSLDFMKTGVLSFFENTQTQPLHQQQQQRYVHQYAVTEQPERFGPVGQKAQYLPHSTQQAMVGYLSNMPMQIYLVPQYTQSPQQTYAPLAEFNSNGRNGAGTADNYVESGSYAQSPARQPVGYVYQGQPTATAALATVQPLLGFHLPVLHNHVPRVLSTSNEPSYFTSTDYTDTSTIDEMTTQTEIPHNVPSIMEFSRHYNSHAPIRGQYNSHGTPVPDLPHPNPRLLKAPPPHLAHLPRTLPIHRPYTKQVYQEGDISSSLAPRPFGTYGPFKRRPTSLLDSYIPSSVQIEYLKRGLAKDPSSLYDALSSGRLSHTIPRLPERGFFPNQMYHTAAGGVKYGHYKRNPKFEKFPYK